MHTKGLTLLFILLTSQGLTSLAQNYEISILTCSPGNRLYSIFGHSAIRVRSTESDLVFNYGTFNYHQPGFYRNFVAGKQDYWLGVEDFRNFYFQYEWEERGILEQKLNLTDDQAKTFVLFLEWNAKLENRDYSYDFFVNNCSTKIRDVLISQVGVEFSSNTRLDFKTYRHAIDHYMEYQPWTKFGISLLLGMPTDKQIIIYEFMFLPDGVLNSVATAVNLGAPLTNQSQELLRRSDQSKSFKYWPEILFTAILIIIFINSTIVKNLKFQRIFLYAFLSTSIVLGLLITYLWFISDHHWTINNLNILWLNPFFLLLFFKNIQKPAVIVSLVFLCSGILIFLLGIQNFHLASLPCMLILVFLFKDLIKNSN